MVTSSASSIHQEALSTFPKCSKSDYPPNPNKCPAQGKESYNCSSWNHYTALCRCNQRPKQPSCNTRARSPGCTGRLPQRETRSRHNLLDNRHRSSCFPSRHTSHLQSHSPSHSPPLTARDIPDGTGEQPLLIPPAWHQDYPSTIPD